MWSPRAAAPPPRGGPANQKPALHSRASIGSALSAGLLGYLKACAGAQWHGLRRGSAELSGHGQPPRALHRRQDAHLGAGHLEGKCPGGRAPRLFSGSARPGAMRTRRDPERPPPRTPGLPRSHSWAGPALEGRGGPRGGPGTGLASRGLWWGTAAVDAGWLGSPGCTRNPVPAGKPQRGVS